MRAISCVPLYFLLCPSTGMEELKWAKNFTLSINRFLWERIFVDDKGVNCTIGDCAWKKIFTKIFFEAHLDR